MLMLLFVFILVSIFELISLFKAKNKKEAFIYIALGAATVSLALFMMLVPEYSSLSKLFFDLFGVSS